MDNANPNPAFGSGLKPFHGIITFMHLPAGRELDGIDVAIVGLPFDSIDQVFEKGISCVIEEIRETVGDRSVYVSLDIDSVDPAFAPGTGTPEVGGLTSYQILRLVRGLHGLNIVGLDLVEVSPPFDHGDITSILAATLSFEFLSLLALQKQRHKEDSHE